MALKSDTEVIIGGKVYTISGYESEEYMQKVASYINNMFNEFAANEAFRKANVEQQGVLMQINIADAYFKEANKLAASQETISAKERELYDVKHELVNAQMKLENIDRNLKAAREELAEKDKKIVRLETELKNFKK
ncbi:MAG: cell division protein ZapA [Lachnospiraceae bacterium]|nr:cell division protein ZapA [Lachnospiraceae bacterium]